MSSRSLHTKQLCRQWETTGRCKFGASCHYVHGERSSVEQVQRGDGAGYVFMCNDETMPECLDLMLFGSSARVCTVTLVLTLTRLICQDIRTMQLNIRPRETRLFLFNFTTRQLRGVFIATEATS